MGDPIPMTTDPTYPAMGWGWGRGSSPEALGRCLQGLLVAGATQTGQEEPGPGDLAVPGPDCRGPCPGDSPYLTPGKINNSSDLRWSQAILFNYHYSCNPGRTERREWCLELTEHWT